MDQDESDEKELDNKILGLSTNDLADLSAEELTGNPTAIKMLLHYYRQLVDRNNALKNDNNTLKTYVDAYGKHKSNSATGAILLAVSNISIGFGVNLLTLKTTWPGVASLLVGVSLLASGIYFSFKKG
ncbi:MAG: hypothetical protein LGR52_15295 [Candidatus Thiosymbion ectosymbiont of Robbea hypermnestra]|nr:hypothetical protein [Candidatus Thiosymbion ectosymbiont of Robbea hypermnestra]